MSGEMTVVIPVEIIAVLKNLKGHEEWVLRHIHLGTNKYYCQQKWNVVCQFDLSVARIKLLFLGKIIIIVSHTVYSKDTFLKRYMAIKNFSMQPVAQSVKEGCWA